MAKKTAKKTAPKKALVKKAPAAGVKRKPAAPKAASAAKPAITPDQIGHAAGAVWSVLDGAEPMTLAALKKAAGQPPELTLLAIGWLAREGKLDFATSGRSVKVSLK